MCVNMKSVNPCKIGCFKLSREATKFVHVCINNWEITLEMKEFGIFRCLYICSNKKLIFIFSFYILFHVKLRSIEIKGLFGS